MPSNKKKSAASRLPRAERAARKTSTKILKSTRSLSERRQKSSSIKSKKVVSRRSVAAQSGSRLSAVQNKKSHAKAPRASTLTASVYDTKGKVVGKVTLPAEIFNVPENPKLLSQAVRVYMSNQRQGTLSTKTRGEVRGSTRKIYRQKGTGRARHGGIRAPIFVGGGVALGPRPRDFSLNFPQKMKRLALFNALSSKLRDGEIKILANLEKIQPKTKIMAKVLKTLDANGKTLLITPGGFKDFENIYKSARNIQGVKILTAVTLNTYEVLDNNKIILMKDSIDQIKKHFFFEKHKKN